MLMKQEEDYDKLVVNANFTAKELVMIENALATDKDNSENSIKEKNRINILHTKVQKILHNNCGIEE